MTIALVGMILITSQQLAFAGFIDADRDGYQYLGVSCDPQLRPDCDPDDNNPCIPDITTTACKASKDPISEINGVKNEINNLIASGDFNINSAQTKALLAKLDIAIKYLTSDKINLAINNLNAFNNMINANINAGKILPEDAQPIISVVNNIIMSLQ